MKSISNHSLSREAAPSLEAVQRKFQTWRQHHSQPRRIPEELWQEAVNLVGKGPSLNCIARTLKLDYTHLKHRSLAGKSSNDGLVEIPLPNMLSQSSLFPLAEIVSPNGVVLRLFSHESDSIIKAFLDR